VETGVSGEGVRFVRFRSLLVGGQTASERPLGMAPEKFMIIDRELFV
jgi:hypothetical protein